MLGWLYDALDKPWQHQKRRLALDRLNTGPLKQLLRSHPPRLAICTHFLPAEILLYLRRKDGLQVRLVVVVTDLDAHALWLYKGVDWYFVAREETRQHLMRLGIPAETIHITGIPVHPAFAVPLPRREARLARGLDPERTTILVVAGGFGVGSVEAIVREARAVRGPVQVVAVCGKNAKHPGTPFLHKERFKGVWADLRSENIFPPQRFLMKSILLFSQRAGLRSSIIPEP